MARTHPSGVVASAVATRGLSLVRAKLYEEAVVPLREAAARTPEDARARALVEQLSQRDGTKERETESAPNE